MKRTHAVYGYGLSLFAVVFIAVVWALIARDRTAPRLDEMHPLVVVTIPPLGMIVKALVGNEHVEIMNLVPAGSSPHTFAPRPSDVRLLAEADLVVMVGGGFDAWAVGRGTQRSIALLPEVPESLRLAAGVEAAPDEDHEGHHEHAADDPHFWTDPRAVAAVLPALSAELAAATHLDSAEVEERRRDFAAALQATEEEIAAQLASHAGEPVLFFHPSFRYFLRRFGLREAGAATSLGGTTAPPRDLAALGDRGAHGTASTLFADRLSPAHAVDSLAAGAGLRVVRLDPLGEPSMDYARWLRDNARLIAEGLE